MRGIRRGGNRRRIHMNVTRTWRRLRVRIADTLARNARRVMKRIRRIRRYYIRHIDGCLVRRRTRRGFRVPQRGHDLVYLWDIALHSNQ